MRHAGLKRGPEWVINTLHALFSAEAYFGEPGISSLRKYVFISFTRFVPLLHADHSIPIFLYKPSQLVQRKAETAGRIKMLLDVLRLNSVNLAAGYGFSSVYWTE